MKRGQITLFVIIGILVLFVVLILLFVYIKIDFLKPKLGIERTIILPSKVKNINSFVENCVLATGYEALYLIGQQGGYFVHPNSSIESKGYYLTNYNGHIISKEEIEKEISSYVNLKLFFCTQNFVDFSDFNVNQGRITTETRIKDDEVVLDVIYPLVITKSDMTFKLKEFNDIKIPIRLGIIYDVVDEIVKDQLENKDSICLSCLVDLGIEKDLYIDMFDYSMFGYDSNHIFNYDMFDYDNNSIIFVIKDINSQINEEPYEFVFVNQYEEK